jgi:hypothetical protein
MHPTVRLVPLGLLASICACARPEAPAAPVATWAIDSVPLLAVGDRAEDDSAVFGRIADVRRLPDGALVVSDGPTVQAFSANGARLMRVGRRGRGPGEFTGALSLRRADGDSVAAWDPGQRRWTLVAVPGGGMRTPGEARPVPTWVHAGIIVHSVLPAPPAWVPGLLRRLSATEPEARLAHLDETGALWLSMHAAHRRWRVYVDSAAPVAEATLPDGFEAREFGRDAVAGILRDSLGLERAAVLALRRTAVPAGSTPGTTGTFPTVDDSTRRTLMAAMRNAVVAQEVHWMQAQRYTIHADSLPVPFPEGARFRIVEASERGWLGVGWTPATGFSCAIVVGLTVPAGWSEGEVRCGG